MIDFSFSAILAFGAFLPLGSAYLVWENLTQTPIMMPKTTPVFLQSTNYPGDNCCTFWDYDNYSGASRTFCHNGSEVTIDMRQDGVDDRESSWICGKSVAYDFCRNYIGDSCQWYYGQTGAGAARNYNMAYSNDLTTLILRPYDPIAQGAVTLFTYSDCHDVSGRLYANSDPNYSAFYNKD